MIHSPIRLLKLAVHLVLGKLGYGLVKLPKDRPVVEDRSALKAPRTEPLVRTISDFSTSPVELYVRKHYEMFRTGHFDCVYPEWRVRRIRKVIDLYGADFKGKRIVELGGGHGDIGAFFAELGAEVLSVEGRKENVDFANIKYCRIPTFKSVQRDLEKDFFDLGRFDLVISFGSLEVIEHIDCYMRSCAVLSNNIVFESFVLDNPDPNKTRAWSGEIASNDQTLHGRARSPSYGYVERVFSEFGFTVERHNDGLNSYVHRYGPQNGGGRRRDAFFLALYSHG